ncbi:MAG: kynureninase [Sphingobacteriales bacterium]|nr:MAG: kynureninase [Sphingobacteriales bacterium]
MSFSPDDFRLRATDLDDQDTLFPFRERFHIPQHNGSDVAYFCGNSLGLQPKSTAYLFEQELRDWAKYGVEGHFQAESPWFSYHKQFAKPLGAIVGALPEEVVAMNTLTVNLQLLMMTFYRPTQDRFKILMEAGAFPSDQYAIETLVRLMGYEPENAIIEVAPRESESTLRTEDIIAQIEAAGSELSLILFGGVQYYTGQFFDLPALTQAAHKVGALAGFDLAHAVGNVPLQLHDWDVDFACWCSYKYLNSGPGGVGGAYIHERFANNEKMPRLAGWWGQRERDRFQMRKGFIPEPGAQGWQLSNAPVFNMVAHRASLDLFDKAGMNALRAKSLIMTAFLEEMLHAIPEKAFQILTPSDPQARGCQLSLLYAHSGKETFDRITDNGIIADWREPNVIRVAPVPMYNTFMDCVRLAEALNGSIA